MSWISWGCWMVVSRNLYTRDNAFDESLCKNLAETCRRYDQPVAVPTVLLDIPLNARPLHRDMAKRPQTCLKDWCLWCTGICFGVENIVQIFTELLPNAPEASYIPQGLGCLLGFVLQLGSEICSKTAQWFYRRSFIDVHGLCAEHTPEGELAYNIRGV